MLLFTTNSAGTWRRWGDAGATLGRRWGEAEVCWGRLRIYKEENPKAKLRESIKNGPTYIKKHLSNQHPNLDRFWRQLGSILGRFWGPKWGQVGTKLLQNSISKSIKKLITFQIALGIDFDRFWAPKWAPIGGQNFYFLAHFSVLGPSWG